MDEISKTIADSILGKTIKEIKMECINFWEICFTDGSSIYVEAENRGDYMVPGLLFSEPLDKAGQK